MSPYRKVSVTTVPLLRWASDFTVRPVLSEIQTWVSGGFLLVSICIVNRDAASPLIGSLAASRQASFAARALAALSISICCCAEYAMERQAPFVCV